MKCPFGCCPLSLACAPGHLSSRFHVHLRAAKTGWDSNPAPDFTPVTVVGMGIMNYTSEPEQMPGVLREVRRPTGPGERFPRRGRAQSSAWWHREG